MTEREQWRFQWPDGTWIRWNAQTQSWEKEEAGGVPTPGPSELEQAQSPAQPALQDVPPPAPAGEPEPTTGATPEQGPRFQEEPTERAAQVQPEPTERAAQVQPEPAMERRSRRPMVDDVLPAPEEPDRPGGSLWPTIIAAVIVGLAVGLLLSSIIR